MRRVPVANRRPRADERLALSPRANKRVAGRSSSNCLLTAYKNATRQHKPSRVGNGKGPDGPNIQARACLALPVARDRGG